MGKINFTFNQDANIGEEAPKSDDLKFGRCSFEVLWLCKLLKHSSVLVYLVNFQ
jgi:hypothetical protein